MAAFYLFSILSLIIGGVASVANNMEGVGFGTPVNMGITAIAIIFWFVVCGINIVNEWARRPVMRLGRYRGEIGPGFVWLNPACEWALDDVLVQDDASVIRIESVQTKDNVPLGFLLVLTLRVKDVRKSVIEVNNRIEAVKERAMASANAAIRAHDLNEILGEGLKFSDMIREELSRKISDWGIETKAVEVKDFRILDSQIEQAISMKARAQKEAEAELVRAEKQKQIVVKLNEAADELDDAGWRFKTLETLIELCRSAQNNTILIPTQLQALAQAFSQGGNGLANPLVPNGKDTSSELPAAK